MCSLERCVPNRIDPADRNGYVFLRIDSDMKVDRRWYLLLNETHRMIGYCLYQFGIERYDQYSRVCRWPVRNGAKHDSIIFVMPQNQPVQFIRTWCRLRFYWEFGMIGLVQLTLCLSICNGLKFGSYSKRCGSKFTGDCRLPLLHNDHSGFMRPQNAGPGFNSIKKNTHLQLPKKNCIDLLI